MQRFLLLVPQHPDELVLVAFTKTFIQLKTVQQLTIFVVELAASVTQQESQVNTSNQVNLNHTNNDTVFQLLQQTDVSHYIFTVHV